MLADRLDLESVIGEACQTIDLLRLVEGHMLENLNEGLKHLGVEAPDGCYVFVFSHEDYAALQRTLNLIETDVKAIEKTFYDVWRHLK